MSLFFSLGKCSLVSLSHFLFFFINFFLFILFLLTLWGWDALFSENCLLTWFLFFFFLVLLYSPEIWFYLKWYYLFYSFTLLNFYLGSYLFIHWLFHIILFFFLFLCLVTVTSKHCESVINLTVFYFLHYIPFYGLNCSVYSLWSFSFLLSVFPDR